MAGKTAVDDDGALDDVFATSRDRGADSAAPASEEPVAPKAEPEPKGEEPAAKAKADEDEPKQYRDPETGRFVPLTELKTERAKRQEEARLRSEWEMRAARAEAALEEARRFQVPRQHQQPQPQYVAEPDPVLDPAGWAQHMQAQMRAEIQQRDFQSRVFASEEIMRSRHADYADVEKVFMAAAQRDPGLVQQMMAHPLPAKYAYEAGKAILAMQRIGTDPDSYERRIRDEERAKVMEELKKGPPQQQRFPGTLADAPASGAQGRVLTDAAMLGDIFSSDRRRRA